MPVVALATTEYVTVIKDGESGFIDTNIGNLIDKMNSLIANPARAADMGAKAKQTALEKFDINRFTSDWENTFRQTIQLTIHNHDKKNSIYQ